MSTYQSLNAGPLSPFEFLSSLFASFHPVTLISLFFGHISHAPTFSLLSLFFPLLTIDLSNYPLGWLPHLL